MSRTLSTDAVAASQRLAFWTDLVCDTYVQLECDPPEGRDRIEGEIIANELTTLQLSRVTASAQLVKRTPALIARASEDHFLVSIQTAGRGVISQDGRHAVLGHLMIGMIRTLAADIDALAPESAAAVADSVSQILIAGLAALPAARHAPVSHLTAYHREQIKALVRSRPADPELNVAQIAQALRLSPSTLHRAWAGEPCSLSDFIWSQRLDAARRALCDPACAARTVSEIAFSWGFNDAAHFSRAFRARFGCSPRDMRPGACA